MSDLFKVVFFFILLYIIFSVFVSFCLPPPLRPVQFPILCSFCFFLHPPRLQPFSSFPSPSSFSSSLSTFVASYSDFPFFPLLRQPLIKLDIYFFPPRLTTYVTPGPQSLTLIRLTFVAHLTALPLGQIAANEEVRPIHFFFLSPGFSPSSSPCFISLQRLPPHINMLLLPRRRISINFSQTHHLPFH